MNTISQMFGAPIGNEPIRRWVPYAGFVSEEIFLTKTGSIGITMAMNGSEYETKTQEQLEQIVKKLVIANRAFDSNFRIYHHLLKREGASIARRDVYSDEIVERLIAERVEHVERAGLYEIRLFTTVLLEGGASGFPLMNRLMQERFRRQVNSEMTTNCRVLQDAIASYVGQLGALLGVSVLDKRGCYRFLRMLLNAESEPAPDLKYESRIDYFAADSAITNGPDQLMWGSFGARVFSLKEEPATTVAHLMRDLMRIEGNIGLTLEWQPRDRVSMIQKVKRKRQRAWGQRTSSVAGAMEGPGADLQKDGAATETASDLDDAIKQMRNKGGYFCDYSLTTIVFGRDERQLNRACRQVKQAFSDKEATLLEEKAYRMRAFFATIPGNSALNLRYRSLLNVNIADLTPCFRPSEGSLTNDHLADEYMTFMQSADGSPVYLNLHHGEVASTLITGTTGSGKSLLLDQMIDDGQKYDPITFIIDVGGSHRLITKRHGGSYAQVRLNERQFGINPFRQPYTSEAVNTILEFIRVLLGNDGHVLAPEQERLVLDDIHAVYGLPERKRRIGRMSLPRDLRDKLHMWLGDGPFAHFVDSERDDLALTKFQTWDFTDLERVPKLLGPLMWYLSRWTSQIVTDPARSKQAKACYMDEGWRFGDLQDFIRSAAKTWRKHRAWIVFATQDEEDLRKADLLNLVNTCCHTKIFLANPGAEIAVYGETFKLNARERELLEQMKIGEFIIKTPTESRKCIYRPSPKRLAEYQSQFTNEELAV